MASETETWKHEHLMTEADQERAYDLKNEILDLCASRKVSTLVAVSAARCAAECFESIINEQGGEVFTADSPSDAEQLSELRKVLHSVREACNHRSIEMIGNKIVQLIPQIDAAIGEK